MNQENDPSDPLLEIDVDMRDFGIPITPVSTPPEKPAEQESFSQPKADEPAPDEPEPDEPEPPIPGPLDEIKQLLNNLSKDFETKIRYDEHKNKIIDELHQTVQDYRQGILQKYVQRIFMDVLKVVDDIRKFSVHYKSSPSPEDVTEKLLNFIDTTASDLEDLFSWEGIIPYACEGDRFDPSLQRVVHKVGTDDPAKDRTIADRIRPGYKYGEKVIRPELVSIFIIQKNGIAEEEKLDGQTN